MVTFWGKTTLSALSILYRAPLAFREPNHIRVITIYYMPIFFQAKCDLVPITTSKSADFMQMRAIVQISSIYNVFYNISVI
jgi:hypothetical protein